MIAFEIRVEDCVVKVRRFGTGDFGRWAVVRAGEIDRLTGRSFEELSNCGNGVWGFEEASLRPTVSPAIS